ncbi:MAG: Rossmann-like and DUF2520 domain-containing protein [Candidatus Sulfotelmatobacter sp.]
MRGRPRITIVGAGNLGSALALSLHRARYVIDQVVFRDSRASRRKAERLAKRVGARAVTIAEMQIEADVVWFCVPDDAIAGAARALAQKADWNGRVALHSSGALSSNELSPLRRGGAHVASVHPMMTFVAGSFQTGPAQSSSQGSSSQRSSSHPGWQPSLAGVPFAIEGDAAAVRASRAIVSRLGGKAYPIRQKDKVAYHAWGTFASPLLTALLATTEHVAAAAGVSRREAKRRMLPILQQTLANYAAFDAAGSFSGPIVRGDVETIRRHLRALRKLPEAGEVYAELAKAAVRYLPGKRKQLVRRVLNGAEVKSQKSE